MERISQQAIVRRALVEDGVADAREMLWKYGITRTAARIAELRRLGMNIETLPREQGHMARYRLVTDDVS